MKRRIVGFYLLMTLLVSGLVSVLSYRNAVNLYTQNATDLLSDATVFIGSAYPSGYNNKPMTVDEFTKESALLLNQSQTENAPEQSKMRVTLIAADGTVLGDSNSNAATMENHLGRPEVDGAITNSTSTSIRKSNTVGVDFLYFARYLPEKQVIVRIALPLTEIDRIRQDIFFVTFGGLAIGLGFSALLVFFFAKLVASPVTKLSRETGKMVEGDLNHRLQVPGKDDLSQLTNNFNTMAEQLEATINALEERNASVNTIINSMHNGLLAVDADMRVMMVNPVVYDMLAVPNRGDALGKPLVAVFRNNILYDTMERSMNEMSEIHGEIILFENGKRILDVQASPIIRQDDPEKRGSLVFLSDVTAVRRLEEMRSAFVSNVTHELKTPLTSIRGFVETLRAGAVHDEKVADRFMEIIDIEADRLGQLIDDILELSDIESTRKDADMTRFDLRMLMQEVTEMLQHAADLKHVKLFVANDEPLEVYASRHRLKQLLINLVDNGIKYNRAEGSVRIEAVKRAGKVQLTVADTGIGIPIEHQTRIFERFYRVDKGRTREEGGTGLGLSIVKHIAQLYNGTVSVKSENGKGTVFTVNLTI